MRSNQRSIQDPSIITTKWMISQVLKCEKCIVQILTDTDTRHTTQTQTQ